MTRTSCAHSGISVSRTSSARRVSALLSILVCLAGRHLGGDHGSGSGTQRHRRAAHQAQTGQYSVMELWGNVEGHSCSTLSARQSEAAFTLGSQPQQFCRPRWPVCLSVCLSLSLSLCLSLSVSVSLFCSLSLSLSLSSPPHAHACVATSLIPRYSAGEAGGVYEAADADVDSAEPRQAQAVRRVRGRQVDAARLAQVRLLRLLLPQGAPQLHRLHRVRGDAKR